MDEQITGIVITILIIMLFAIVRSDNHNDTDDFLNHGGFA